MSAREQIIGGGQELDDLLKTLPGKVQKNITRASLRAGAAVLLREVKQNIPVSSGDMQRTARITGRIRNGEVTVSVKVGGKYKGVDVWYAHMVEYGTRPHTIKPEQRGGVLRFGEVIARSVEHPGARARPFMRPAVDAKFGPAIEAMRDKVRERLTKEGLNVPAPLPLDPEE